VRKHQTKAHVSQALINVLAYYIVASFASAKSLVNKYHVHNTFLIRNL
jgi:hypothetical protein